MKACRLACPKGVLSTRLLHNKNYVVKYLISNFTSRAVGRFISALRKCGVKMHYFIKILSLKVSFVNDLSTKFSTKMGVLLWKNS